MNKTYQPQVIKLGNNMIESLLESGFFAEQEITDHTPAIPVVCDFLTEKFIEGKLNDGAVEFTEKEFTTLLGLMNAACVLNSLKKKGFANSYEDENTEEVFFLTKEGEEIGEMLKNK